MSLYVIVEGRRTEPRLYRAWLPMLIPGLEAVSRIEDAGDHHFFILAGYGYPSYLDRVRHAVEDLHQPGSPFTLLLVCADAEERGVEDRLAEIADAIDAARPPVPYWIVVADCCIETWLLGHRKFVRRAPHDAELRQYLEHYDVVVNDPEGIPSHPGHRTRAQLCTSYLRAVFRERGQVYSKRNPGVAADESYFEALRLRAQPAPQGPGHIASFTKLLQLRERYPSVKARGDQ